MPSCAACGATQELRLYDLRGDLNERRRWWCVDCFSLARGQGVEAVPAPVWVERAALYRLPLKPITVAHDRRVLIAGRRASDRPGASQVASQGRRETFSDSGH
jgi:hypothetical protein